MDGVGDMDHGWRRRRHRTCVHTDAPDGARPRGERKDALDTVVRLRCRAQVASVAAAAAAAATAASLGVKPQAEAPHSAPVAPRGTLRRRLRRRTTCKARARTLTQVSAPSVGCCTGASRPDLGVRAQLHRSARASRRAAKGPRAGRWQVDRWEQLRPPTRLEPAAAGRRRAEQGDAWKKRWWHAQIKGFEPVPEEAVALAFFRVPRIKCFVQKVLN